MNVGATGCCWRFAEYTESGRGERLFDVPPGRSMLGRTAESTICISVDAISKQHAELERVDERLWVRDLRSTNGTFVNGGRIDGRVELHDGDLVQFASVAFRVSRVSPSAIPHEPDVAPSMTVAEGMLTWAQLLFQFDRLISERAVVPFFQPIFDLASPSGGKPVAYEVLARSSIVGLENPALLFGTAERLNQEEALSELMRVEGVRVATEHSLPGRIFLNTHPKEVVSERFLESLRALRRGAPDAPITVEVHEGAVTQTRQMQRLRDVLGELDMQLAYDDFGVGQARLVELTEVPPDVLKFDMSLIRDIDRAPPPRLAMIRALIDIAHSLRSVPLAEGVETLAEHEACVALGFAQAQGFYYGRPHPVGP